MTVKKALAIGYLRTGRTWREIEVLTGLSESTIARLSKGEHSISESVIQALMSEEEDKLTLVQHRLVDSILETPDEDLAKIPVNQRMVAAAVAIDKRELLAGRPTQRVQVLVSDDSLIAREIDKLRKVLEDAGLTERDFIDVTEGEIVDDPTFLDH